jgi:hypothetical protein
LEDEILAFGRLVEGEFGGFLVTVPLAVIEELVQHPRVPVELVLLRFGRLGNLEEIFHRAVVSKGAPSDVYRQLKEDQVKEKRARLQAFMGRSAHWGGTAIGFGAASIKVLLIFDKAFSAADMPTHVAVFP